MANEIVSTVSTLAGLMQRTQAIMSAKFVIQSRLFGSAGWWVEALNSSAVQFPKIPAPSPVSEHATEADVASATAVTVSAGTATLTTWTQKTTVSKLAILGGQDIPATNQAVILNNVVAGVDKHIASIATEAAFTTAPQEDCVTASAFQNAVTTLRNTGYNGELYAWMTEYMLSEIMADLRQVNLPISNEDFLNSGYRGRLMGVAIYTLPSSWCPVSTTTAKKNGLIAFKDFGVGIGYHKGDPGAGQGIIHPFIKEESLHYELSATAYVKAAALAATGGLLIVSDSATK